MKKRNIIGLILMILIILVAYSLINSIQGTKKYVDLGIAEYKKGNYSQAIDYYEKATKSDQDNAIPYNNRGLAYIKLKELDKAISNYNKAIELKPEYEEAYLNRGLVYYKSGGWSDAKIMKMFKSEPYEKSIQDLTRAIELNPNNGEAYYQRGLAYNRLIHYYNKPFNPDMVKIFEKARDDFNKVLVLDPEYVLAHAGLGNLYYRYGEHAKATGFYDKLLKNKDTVVKKFGTVALAAIYTSRGRNYLCFQKKWPELIADCKKAFELDPRIAHAALIVAVVSLLTNNNDEALSWCDKAIASTKKYPENKGYPYIVWAYFAKGAVAFRQGKIERAVERLRFLVDKHDSFLEGVAYRHLGLCYRKLGNEKASADAFEKGIAWDTKSIESGLSQKAAGGLCYLAERFFAMAYAERGHSYLALGKFDEAISDFNKVENMDPVYFAWADPYMVALMGLGRTYAQMGNSEAAKQWFEKAQKVATDREQIVTMKQIKGLLKSLG